MAAGPDLLFDMKKKKAAWESKPGPISCKQHRNYAQPRTGSNCDISDIMELEQYEKGNGEGTNDLD